MKNHYENIQKSRIYLQHLIKTYESIFNKSNPQLNQIAEHLEYAESLAKPLTDDGETVIRITKTQYENLLKQSEMFHLLSKAQTDAHELKLMQL